MFEERNEKRNWKFWAGAMVLMLVLSLAAGAFGGFLGGQQSGVITGSTQAVRMKDGAVLGDAITDNVYVYGQMRSYDGSDNWADISDVGALDRGNGWHAAYNVTGWGSASAMQAGFFNTQVATTTVSGKVAYGIEGKATFSSGTSNEGTGIGIFGKMTVKTTNTELAAGYPFYSIIDVNNSAVITNSASYYAELSGEATLGTVSVLQTKSGDTWDYGVNFSGATITSDVVGQNGETLDNATDTAWVVGGFTALEVASSLEIAEGESITVTTSYQPVTAAGAITTSATTAITDGPVEGAILVIVNTGANNIIIKDGANTKLGGDITLTGGADDSLTVIWDGADWVGLAMHDN